MDTGNFNRKKQALLGSALEEKGQYSYVKSQRAFISRMACFSYLLIQNRDKQVSSHGSDCLLGCRQEYGTGEKILDCCCLGPSLTPLFYFTPSTFMLSLSLSLCLHLGFSFMMLEIEARAPKHPRQILYC